MIYRLCERTIDRDASEVIESNEIGMSEHVELHQLVGNEDRLRGKSGVVRLFRRRWSCAYLGIFLATLSSLFFSLCSVIVKHLVETDPLQLAMFRYRAGCY